MVDIFFFIWRLGSSGAVGGDICSWVTAAFWFLHHAFVLYPRVLEGTNSLGPTSQGDYSQS